MLRKKAFKFRIYPTKEQEILINKTMGCSRFVFNLFLDKWQTELDYTGKGLTYHKCAKELPSLKSEYPWLKEVDSVSLQSSLKHLADAYHRLFKKQNKKPRFKSRKNPVQSYTTKFTNNNIQVFEKHVQLPKLGIVRYANSRKVEGRILSATVRRSASGKYFVSILTEVEIHPLPPVEKTVGIDLGLKDFAVFSDGTKMLNPRHLHKYAKQLARWQRVLSRRKKDGQNWLKAKLKIAKLHEKIANTRNDFLQKLSSKLIRENQVICLEDLNVKELLQEKEHSKSIADVSWSKFVRAIAYKAEWYGRQMSKVDTYFPSTQICSVCGAKNSALKDTAIRKWMCTSCHTTHDRDQNASINIEKEGLRLLGERLNLTASGTTGIA